MSAVLEAREPSARYLETVDSALVQQFDLLATAPGGMARLRELMLSLAVQGKLVPRNPADQPAPDMVARLVASRSVGGKRGIGADLFNVANCDPSTLPCDLPTGWAWIRLSDLGEFCGGKTPSKQNPTYWSGSIPWITPKDMKQLRLADSEDHVSQAAVDDGLAPIPRHSLLIVVRSGILRRTVPVAINDVETTINQDLKALKLAAPEMASYLQLLVRGFERFILENLTKVGTTVESIRFDDFAAQPFPFPPLAEQARIVARVDELMRLCDALEAQGRLEAAQHAQLLSTLLGTLTDSASPEELAANWQRVAAHFDLLLDRPEAVDALEQTILQLAVRGLLVPQDSEDEPATSLMQKVLAKKELLVSMGQMKRERALQPTTDDAAPFNLPGGWVWARLQEAYDVRDGTHDTPKYHDTGIPLVTSKNLSSGRLDLTDVKLISVADHVAISARSKVDRDDILFAMIGSIGNPVLVDTDVEFSIKNVALFKHYDHELSDPNYLLLSLNVAASEMKAKAAGGVQSFVSLGQVRNTIMAIPPLAEQGRIVSRVAELRRLCADLRQRLADSQTTQSRLADALVESTIA